LSERDLELLSLRGKPRKMLNLIDLNPHDPNINKLLDELTFYPTSKFLQCPV